MKQIWNPDGYKKDGGFVTGWGDGVIQLLDPKPGERILDLGCGAGTLARKIADAGADVYGIDFSEDFVALTREKGIPAEVMDGQAMTFDTEFDAVFSNATLHWLLKADDAIASVARALKPGGRFVAECGGAGNLFHVHGAERRVLARWGYDAAEMFPLVFHTDLDYRAKLEAAGFEVPYIELVERPAPLPTDLRGWYSTFTRHVLDHLPETDRDRFLDAAVEEARPHVQQPDGSWVADYVRLRFVAFKK